MTLPNASPDQKTLILGTALWGWGIDRATAYRMLERFLMLGGCIVDTAANYPINKRPEDFGLAASWISDWITSNGTAGLSILIKVGAKDNMGSPTVDLSASSILQSEAIFRNSFGAALAAIAVHWDSRGDDENDSNQIADTIAAMAKLQSSGLSIGFSGIRRPDLYLKAAPELSSQWWIQVKENAQTNVARLNYSKHFPSARYLAYGINMGGLKAEQPSENSSLALRGIAHPDNLVERLSEVISSSRNLRPTPKDFNELALLTSYLNPALSGTIIGPRNVGQLESTMHFWNRLGKEAPSSMQEVLIKLDSSPKKHKL